MFSLTDTAMQRSFVLTVLTLLFSFDLSLAHEQKNAINEDIVILDKNDKILQV